MKQLSKILVMLMIFTVFACEKEDEYLKDVSSYNYCIQNDTGDTLWISFNSHNGMILPGKSNCETVYGIPWDKDTVEGFYQYLDEDKNFIQVYDTLYFNTTKDNIHIYESRKED